MDKFKQILKTQYNVVCSNIAEVYGGSSGMNSHYKVTTDSNIYVNCNSFFLKIVKLFPHPEVGSFRLRQPPLFRSTMAINTAI